jgi:hypothetical protein
MVTLVSTGGTTGMVLLLLLMVLWALLLVATTLVIVTLVTLAGVGALSLAVVLAGSPLVLLLV